jgi:hypothetical protein
MCIFCGGACGGVVDMALPSVAAAASLVVLKVKASKALRKSSKAEEEKQPDEAEGGEG